MEDLVTSLNKLPVYTRNGKFVGNVKSVLLDVENKKVASILVTKTNPELVEGGIDVAIPYRWVNAVGDIIILSYFPERVRLEDEGEAEVESETTSSEEVKTEIETIDEPILRE
ncbi:MAG TPA: photosystem reaction center subunit H [Thermoplasmatales archaeon]|nr:PRC-barrel domain-containing protein [Thermoplasmata archaeon]HHF59307.1 photosystem reaction center subunit H [Thermoplasmatales archaeon]